MALLNWGNAFSQAGAAVASVGLEGVKATLEQDKIRLADELAEGRSVREGDRSEGRSVREGTRAEERQVRAEGRAPTNAAALTKATEDAKAAAVIRNAPGMIDVKRQEHDEDTRAQVERFKQLAPLQRQQALETKKAELEAMSTPEALAAARKIAQATHIVDPSYTAVPNADGTVDMVDARNPKNVIKLTGPDGKPIVRRDSAEIISATALINNANTELKLAEAAYKVDSTSLEPGAKEKAEVRWAKAQQDAKEQKAAALAVLSRSAKIPEGEPKPATDGVARPKSQAEFDAIPAGGQYINPADGRTYVKRDQAAKAGNAEPTVKLAPGAPDPNEALRVARRAAAQEAEAKAAEEKRQKRLREREADAAVSEGFRSLAR